MQNHSNRGEHYKSRLNDRSRKIIVAEYMKIAQEKLKKIDESQANLNPKESSLFNQRERK